MISKMKQKNKENTQNLLRKKFMKLGVKLIGPETVFFSKDTKIGKNVSIEPYVVFGPKVKIGNNVLIKSFSYFEGCKIDDKSEIGPYARIRPDTHLKKGVKVGNFVETKNTTLGSGSKANHFTYLGDTTVGTKTNIGAGTITCNYDGKDKHKTIVGDNSFIGSNSSLVAPVKIGNNTTIAAGSTITKDVQSDALGVARAKQSNKDNWSKKKG